MAEQNTSRAMTKAAIHPAIDINARLFRSKDAIGALKACQKVRIAQFLVLVALVTSREIRYYFNFISRMLLSNPYDVRTTLAILNPNRFASRPSGIYPQHASTLNEIAITVRFVSVI